MANKSDDESGNVRAIRQIMRRLSSVLLKCGLIALVVFASAPAGGPAFAASQTTTEHTRVALISEAQEVSRAGESWFAIRIILDAGWHTYWLNSGDSGNPVKLTWTLPAGVEAGEISWPYPSRLTYGHLVNYGMVDDVWLLVPISFKDVDPATETVQLSVHVAMLVCEIQCVPEDVDLDIEIGLAAVSAPPDIIDFRSDQFENARLKHPKTSPWESEAWRQGDRFLLRMDMPEIDGDLIRDVKYFPVTDGWIRNAAEQRFIYQDGAIYLETEIGHSGNRFFTDETTVAGVLVVEEELATGTVTQPIYVTSSIPAAAPIVNLFPSISTLEAILYAILGGIILNAMPCVFPVLSIKILTLVREASGEVHEMRKQGLVYGLSVIVGFLLIGGLFLGLRGVGEAVGWGFQLQSPIVVLMLGYVMFAVALSLVGVFDFGFGFNITSTGQAPKGTRGSVLTGILAVVVASPCTAPFMVVAMGFALFEPTLIALLIFASLGLGMALPYMALAFWPGLLSRLPKPGPWMERLKQILAIPMLATVAWLFWVLTLQTSLRALVLATSGLVFIALAAWLLQLRSRSDGGSRAALAMGAAAFALVATAVVFDGSFETAARSGNGLADSQIASPIPSVPWSVVALEAAREAGDPVFLNFTAGWCITCLLNEQVALSSDRVVDAFADNGITYMKADWTSRDDEITAALRGYGRSGVPLYIFFGPGGMEGVILPQLLTEGILLDHIEQTRTD